MGISIRLIIRKDNYDNDKKNEVLQFVQERYFLITYYAKKHKKIITRKGTWTKPNTIRKARFWNLVKTMFLSIGI